jgi:dipeptidyl aminopeptidase/acylaminoacyl peptidase
MYGNIGRYEIPDHVAALKEVAAQRSYMDMSRVGIFGISWGGYFATRAMLLAPDVYKVGVASSPATDLRGLAMVTVEPYMGVPEHNEAGYDYGSNLKIADRLQGKLLLVAGTSDANAPFSHTMQLVDALVKADKRFDLLIFPEQPHVYTGHASDYWIETIRRYFVTNLLPERGAN